MKGVNDFQGGMNLISKEGRALHPGYIFVVLILLFLVLISMGSILSAKTTGKISLDQVGITYQAGEPIGGILEFSLNAGEHVPSDSLVVLRVDDQTKEYLLSSFASVDPLMGNFYAHGTKIKGFGEGYGIFGEKVTYPEVEFEILIYPSSSDESDDASPVPFIGRRGGSEVADDSPVSSLGGGQEQSDEEGDSGIGLTGAVAKESFTVKGRASKYNDFNYELDEGYRARLVEGSVRVDGNKLDDTEIGFSVKGDRVSVATGYSQIEYDFGEEYLTDKEYNIARIDLMEFNLIAEEDVELISVSLFYDGEILASTEKKIAVVQSGNNTTDSNLSIAGNVSVERIQKTATLGEPVRWQQKVNASQRQAKKVVIDLPDYAESVEVTQVIKSAKSDIGGGRDIVIVNYTEKGDRVNVYRENEGREQKEDERGSVITGQVTARLKLSKEDRPLNEMIYWISTLFSRPTGFAVYGPTAFVVSEKIIDGNLVEVSDSTGQEIVEEVIVEYETPAPYALEKIGDNEKEVVIIGPDDVHYSDVISFTDIPESFRVKNTNNVKINWKNNGSYIVPTTIVDRDNNGYYDYIEWVTPILSNQTFIIEIVRAEHLDEKRDFISNVYNEAIKLDSIWTETIPESHYVRVAFEENLTKVNDITVFPRIVAGSPRIEVYEIGSDEMLAEFPRLIGYSYNKIYLNNLSGEQDTFDLKIVNGSVEFDHIIDPSINLSVSENYTSINNVTVQNNFSHLSIDRSSLPYNSLVLYIPFDANVSESKVYDYSVQENDGNIDTLSAGSDAHHLISGPYGGSFAFDGQGDSVTIGDASSISGFNSSSSFTVGLWFRTNDSSTTRYMTGDFKLTPTIIGWAVLFDTSSKRAAFVVRNGGSSASCSFSTFVTDNNWHYFVGSYNGSTTSCRLDGSVMIGASYSGSDFGNDVGVSIGSPNSASVSGSWNGSIDEVMIFNTSLTSSQSSNIWQNTSNRFYSRGIQDFNGLDVSGTLDNENNMNVTINPLLYFGDVNFKLQVGSSTPSGYSYGNEHSFVNGVAGSVPVNTPTNTSIRLIFNADSSNRFYTPVVTGNITLDTVNATFSCRTLNVPGQTYVLNNNIITTGTCFNVTAEDIILDGSGYTLQLSELAIGVNYGVSARGISNLTIKNININGFARDVITTPLTSSTDAGSVRLTNSSVGSIEANGGHGGSLSDGGNIYLYNSLANNMFARAGNVTESEGDAGSGGNIYIENSFIYINRSTISLQQKPGNGGDAGMAGRLILNFSQGFNDLNAAYSNDLYLDIINRSVSQVRWLSQVNSTGMTNISLYYNSFLNRTFVNGDSLAGLDTPANITFFGMAGGFTNPSVLKDGSACFDCNNFTSLNAGIVIFNVSGFSTYEVGESSGIVDLNSCGVLSSSNTIYNMTASITPLISLGRPCLNVTADNVTIEGNGLSVGASSFVENVIHSRADSTKVRNINIMRSTTLSQNGGLYLEGANNSDVSNSNFTGNIGVIIDKVHHSRFVSNYYDVEDRGINSIGSDLFNNSFESSTFLDSNYGVVIEGNDSRVIGSSFSGHVIAAVYVSGSNNIIANNTIASSQGEAIDLSDSSGSSIHNVTITGPASSFLGVDFDSSTNTEIIDTPFGNYSFTGNGGKVRILDSGVGEINFLAAINGSGGNFSRDVFISSNLVSVRSDLNPGLNRSANVTLHSMPGNFTQPYIFRDDLICEDCNNFTSLNAASVVFNASGFTNYSVIDVPTCLALSSCAEGSDCTIDRACSLSSDLCTGGICDFGNIVFTGVIYTLHDSAGNGKSLAINASGNFTFSSGKGVIFGGKDRVDQAGGAGGTVNITMPSKGLFNRTNAVFTGTGGDSIQESPGPALVGGDGGILQINYHGLLGSSSLWTTNLAGGTGPNGNGASGSVVYNKYLTPCPRDADVDNSGVISLADAIVITSRYNNLSSDSGFNSYHDINCDNKLSVIELSRIGFEFGRGESD